MNSEADPETGPEPDVIRPAEPAAGAVAPPGPATPRGPAAARVVRGGDFLFVSGLVAVDPQSGEPLRGTTASETRQVLGNLAALLEAAGSGLDRVVKVNVLLHSMLEAPNMNEVYAGFFPAAPPARTVCGATLPDRMKVMIECTALG